MPDPEIVGGPDAASPPVPDSGKPPGGEPDKKPAVKADAKPDGKPARDYETELAEKNRQIEELNQSALHWYNKAQGVTAPRGDEDEPPAKRTKAAPAEPDEDEDPDKFVNKLATVGSKAIDEYMAKRGYLPAKDIEETIQARVDAKIGSATSHAQLIAKYPDLENESSELFRETQKDYQEMISLDKSLAKSPAAIKIAVKTATARLKAAFEIAEARKPKETEAERRTRIAAQAGDTGRYGGGEFSDDKPIALDDEAKDMMRKFNQAGGGPDISEEALLKRMARGPRMVYRPGRDTQGRFQ
ncbi:MAG: hypothetical protein V1790_17630 [Planctomycetota bacterium]